LSEIEQHSAVFGGAKHSVVYGCSDLLPSMRKFCARFVIASQRITDPTLGDYAL
jgi:hypothetical protein